MSYSGLYKDLLNHVMNAKNEAQLLQDILQQMTISHPKDVTIHQAFRQADLALEHMRNIINLLATELERS